ncbi:MAG TPA: hypothetical protein VMD75_16130 [Candidatus Binataceae bacterium]|nr:hypothetical protein [Candidatus Binataceae bacterium]
MKGIIISGAILALLGLLAFAIPVFTTQHTEDVAKLGSLKVQANEQQTHVIPPLLSGGVLILGLVLIGVGVAKR